MDGWIRIGTKVETKEFDAQIKELERKAQTLEKTLETDMEIPVELRMDEESRIKLRSDLQKTKNKIISLQEQANKGVNVRSKETVKNFEDMFKSAKRFALGLISIRGIYTILSRASQAYMSTDEATTKQMEANWVGLGTILAPAIDLIVSLFKKAVTSILYFMSVLTGVNYIEKANTAILKKQTQATNDLTKANNKLTASFDEMNILQEQPTGGVSTEINTDALFDINDIGESARQTIEKIAKALQPVYEIIKNIIKYCLDNPKVIIGMLGGVALLSMLGKVIGYAGAGTLAGTGLAGVLGLLVAISSLSVITISIKTIIDSLNDLKNTLNTVDEIGDSVVKMNQKINNAYRDFINNNNNSSKSVQNLTDQLLNQINTSMEHNKNIETTINELGWYERMWWKATGAIESNGQVMYKNTQQIFNNVASLIIAEKQGKLTEEQSEKLTEQLKKLNTETDIATLSTEQLALKYDLTTGEAKLMKDMIQNISNEHVNYMEKTYGATKKTDELSRAIKNVPSTKKVEIDVDTSKATTKTKSWWKNLINDGFVSHLNLLSNNLGFSFKIPKLATGGIVNNPGRGVMMGSYVAGEKGPEAVLPLTDNTLQRLANMIPITINLTNTMNGRVISRELQKINTNSDFVTNS